MVPLQNHTLYAFLRYFIDAIESRKYGWFWKCENGEDCM
jgi:hypothetical protein